MNAEQVGNLEINLPPMEEQCRIADFLDAETARIDQLAQMQQKVSLRLSERDTTLLDLEIDRLIEKYGQFPFRRSIRFMEQGSSPQGDIVPAGENEWGVLKVSSVRSGCFIPTENKLLSNVDHVVPSYEVHSGDLLVTRANTPLLVGATVAVSDVRRKLMLCDKIFRIFLKDGVDAGYIEAVARGSRIRSLCTALSHGTSQSMVNLKAEDVKEWPIPAAPWSVQISLRDLVAANREHTERLKSAIESQLALLTERRQALITAAVTGQIDVTTARGLG